MKVFTNCVSKKQGEIKADISQIKEPNLDQTYSRWKALTQGGLPAYNVYTGYSWEFIKSIHNKVPIEFISAGYGILGLEDPIVPYKITFSNKFFDKGDYTIPTFGLTQHQANLEWFNKIAPIVSFSTSEPTLITCNPDYLKLLNIPQRDNLIVLNNYKLTRLSKWLGAGSHAISNRFAKFIVEEYPNIKGNKELSLLFSELDKKYGETLRTKRQSVSNEFIINWANSGKSLTELRNEGHSCSYQRFIKLQDPHWVKNNPKGGFTKNFKK